MNIQVVLWISVELNGAGYVRAVGSKVTKVKSGDAVLLSFAFCTQCHSCKFGAPGYCHEFTALNFSGSGEAFHISKPAAQKVGGSFFGQSSFAKLTRVQETSLVKVTELITHPEDLKLFAPLGCGIQTGAGTIAELADAKPDDKVAIMGLGGVGLAAIMGAKLRGCKTIIGIDRVPARIEMAKRLGATHGIDTSAVANLGDEVRRITNGSGSTITVDATGVMPLIQQGLDFTANQGKMVLLGVAPTTAGLEISVVPFMVTGKQLMGSMEGGVLPEDYIPRMIRWFQKGQFPIERLIKFFPVGDFEKAIHDMENGSTIKPVLICPDRKPGLHTYGYITMTKPSSNSSDPEVGHHEALHAIRSAASISMSPELFEKPYLAPPNAVKGDLRKTFGNPTPLALAGFLLALMPLSCDLMGWRGASHFGAASIPVYFFEGGVLMVISGIMEWILGNSFPSCVFTSFGFFYLSFGGILHPSFAAYSSYAPADAKSPAEGMATKGFNASLGFILLAMTILSIIYLICALRTNVRFVVIFATLVPALLCLLGAFWAWADDYTGNTLLAQRLCVGAGALLFVTSFSGWYILLAILLAIVDFPTQIPVGDLSSVIKGKSERDVSLRR
ncbi:long-chain alcohol dehydrogenase [Fusarium bulbicola]|nr:long-chain alcohol dehydrogenase [Fusarium bulbicola]